MALKDTSSVVGTLSYVLGAILQAIFFFLYLLILQVRLVLKGHPQVLGCKRPCRHPHAHWQDDGLHNAGIQNASLQRSY